MLRQVIRVSKYTATVTPACYRSDNEYRWWLEMARIKPPVHDNWVCEDCTEEYQQRMNKLGRCAYPEKAVETIGALDDAS